MDISVFLFFIPLLPLLGFIILGIGSQNLPKQSVAVIANGTILASFILSIIIFTKTLNDPNWYITFKLFDFIKLKTFEASFTLACDRLTSVFLLVITGVGFFIHVFSVGYMYEDKGFARFFSYLNLFIFSMLILVLGSNFLIIFIGWEGVGLCSFLLIGFWYQNQPFTWAARKAFIMNRIGDLGFLFAIFWTYKTFGTIEIYDIQQSLFDISVSTTDATIITLSLFIAATGKSAQIPLFTWLPDAMAGPTPVSALIHAATMVTSGIYLIAKTYFIFNLAPVTLTVIAYTGLATALVSASIACVQTDIKKVLANSTVSQLGYMVLALGIGNYVAAVFYVITHAFFKGLLFLGSGSIIHSLQGEQDMGKMGGLKKYLKHTHATFLIGCLAISAIPGFSGFFAKDQILNSALEYNIFVYVGTLFTAALTVFYTFRMYFLTFWGKYRGSKKVLNNIHESPLLMLIPLYVLALLAIFGGYINVPELFGGNSDFFKYLAIPSLKNAGGFHLTHLLELILIISIFVGTIFIIFYSKIKYSLSKSWKQSHSFITKTLFHSYYIDHLYKSLFITPIYSLSTIFIRGVESMFDGIVEGCGNVIVILGKKVRYIQTGYINNYLFWFVLGVILVFILYLV